MTETIPFIIAENILRKLGSSAFQHLAMITGVEDEMRKLCNTLTSIRAVLVDADEQQEKSLVVKNWIKNLKDVVHDIDDILDELSTRASKTEAHFGARMKAAVSQFFSSSNQLIFRYKMGKRMRSIKERLDEIACDMAKFNFRSSSVNVTFGRRERAQTHSYALETNVAGREEDREEMVKLLMCPSDQENVSTVAIVGVGGLGKTTLAKLVYNDTRIVRNFDLRIWVSVNDEFNVKSIIEKILACGTGRDVKFQDFVMEAETNSVLDKMELEQLQILVREKLDGKKYLLIMDDVWNENHEMWIKVNELLIGGDRGSKIVTTTRSQKVAVAMDAECVYMLQGLPEDASWSLFKQLAFRNGQEDKHPNLVEIGKKIAKKCYGVPLAIRTLGSTLRSTEKESEWLSIQNNEIWEWHDIMNVLKLSYDRLPVGLKQCFTYCSLFPKGYEFEIRSLIQLWMAQGYISQLEMEEQMEETGTHYFEELLLRSFFQDVKRDDHGNIISCKMHYLMHDLACSIAKPECCIAEADGKNICAGVHHVSFSSYLPSSWTLSPSLLRVKKMRTLLFPFQYQMGSRISVEDIFSCFRRLRVLDLHFQRIEKLPRAIGELIHLRYFDLSRNFLTTLPSSIGKLQNFQTLKLERCYKFEELPIELTKIVDLRHLEIRKCSKLTHMPLGFGKLTSLRTLSRFVLGKNYSDSKCGGLGELKYLNNLSGELCIMNLEHVKNASECEAANMKDKEHLQSLRLNWSREDDGGEHDDAAVMESLHPHTNLRELHVAGYGDVKFPTWISTTKISLFPYLDTITIERCFRCQELPSFAEIPFLRVLKLYSLNLLNCLSHNSNSSFYFPSLKELVLFDLPLLSDWPRNSAEKKQQQLRTPDTYFFPCLTKLTIIDCPNLISLPSTPSLEVLVADNIPEQLRSSLIPVDTAYFQSS